MCHASTIHGDVRVPGQPPRTDSNFRLGLSQRSSPVAGEKLHKRLTRHLIKSECDVAKSPCDGGHERQPME